MQEAQQSSLVELLLSGGQEGDAAGSEGLTASALQEYLHKVDVRREEVLLTLYATVAERFASQEPDDSGEAAAGSSSAAAGGEDPSDADAAFSAALARLGEQAELALEDGGAAAGLGALATQHAAVLAAERETAGIAASVRVAAEMQQRLADFDAAVATGAYSEAAWAAVELQKAVAAVPDSEDTAAQVAARVAPLQEQLLAAVCSYWAPDPSTHLPVLLLPWPGSGGDAGADQQQQQGEGAEGGAAGGQAAGTAGTAAALAEMWRALEVFGLLQQALQQLAALFLEHCVQPILAAEQAPTRSLTDSPAGSVASSNLSRATAAGGGRGGNSPERQLYKALKALAEQVLCGSQEWAEQLGPLLWPPFAAAYIAAKLAPIQPQSDAEVELYSRKSSLGAKLEQKAVALHLLPGDRDGPITRHIKRALNQFLNARRNRFITSARDLLVSPAAQESVTVGVPRRSGTPEAYGRPPSAGSGSKQQPGPGAAAANGNGGAAGGGGLEAEDPLLSCGEYAISMAAQGAVNLMRDALAEAVRSGNTALAQAMCGAVVDVAAMLVALPPPGASAPPGSGNGLPLHPAAAAAAAAAGGEGAPEQPDMLLLPYPAAVRHNDCHYVYQALCNLPYQFSPRLQQLVHRNVNFINPAVRVRQAGQECLQAMVAQQERELLGLVQELNRFDKLTTDGQAEFRYRNSVAQLLGGFRRLGSVLRPVLGPGVLVEVSAQLIQAVCTGVIEEVMSLNDISVDESEQIPQLLEPLTRELQEAVLLPDPAAAGRHPRGGGAAAAGPAAGAAGQQQQQAGQQQLAVGGVGLDELSAALGERTPAVMKLRELCELLDIRMVEIRRRWQDGRLQAIGFSADEISHLVLALFEDTDLRRDFLRLLAEGDEGAGLL